MNAQIASLDNFLDTRQGKIATVAVTGASVAAFATLPASAQVADVNTMVSSLGGVVTGVTGIILVAMGTRYAIKLVNRVAVKG
jgi:hypothetical protein